MNLKLKVKRRRGLGELGNLVIIVLFGVMLLTTATMSYTGLIMDNGGATPADATALTGATQAYSDLNASTTEMAKTLKGSEGMPLGTGVFYVMFQGAFQAVQMLFNITGIFGSLFANLGPFFGEYGIGVDLSTIMFILGSIVLVYIIWRLLEGGTGRQW